MKKRFKSRKIKRNRIFIFFFILIISFGLGFNYLFDILKTNIDDGITYLMFDHNKNLMDILNMSSTEFLLYYSLGIRQKNEINENADRGIEFMEMLPVENSSDEPIVYIYNSHQSEEYSKEIANSYNISPTVLFASYMLKEELEKIGISALVETNKISDVLANNGWKYKSSYKASRLLLEDAKRNNSTLKYYFDLHRDSSNYEKTLLQKDGISYAKVLFVVGLDYDNYEYNLNRANRLNDIIKDKNFDLSRGVLKKSGSNVNGIYNQDFDKNVFLIEVGGQYNNVVEVKNTIAILAQAINDLINEDLNEEKT